MRVPLSWLREYVDLPAGTTGRDVAAKLIDAGLEVETVEQLGGIKGPLVVGKVLTIEELEGFKKPIRFCTVDVGSANGTGEPQEIVCGAENRSEQQVEVGEHRGPLGSTARLGTADFDLRSITPATPHGVASTI